MSQRHSATLEVRGIKYKIAVLDEEGVPTDPTLLIFREDEEEAVVTVHLDPRTSCNYFMRSHDDRDGHIVVREGEDVDD